MLSRTVKKKINMLGDPAVGKTSLIIRYVNNVFGEEYLKTIGTNIYSKSISIVGSDVKLIIQDIMGEKKYESVQETAFRDSGGALAICDATNKASLDSLIENWLPRYRELAGRDAPILLAINKVDLEDREITDDFIDPTIQSYFKDIYFTSAKTGENVENMFEDIASRLLFKTTHPDRRTVEDFIDNQIIDGPNQLMDTILAYTSEKGGLEYDEIKRMLKESNIDLYELDEKLNDENVMDFASKVIGWYKENQSEEMASSIEKLVNKYE